MRSRLNLLLSFFLLLCLTVSNGLYAQRNIGPPELQDFAACASTSFNSYTVIATLGPGNALPSDNQFILQLSNASGSFDSDVQDLDVITGPNNQNGGDQELLFENFPVPEDVNSDTYRMRVITSSEPVIISAVSEETAMHFFRSDLDRPRLNGGDSDVIFCEGSVSKTLIITLLDGNGNDVAGDFVWEWFRDGAVIAGVSGTSFDVNNVGRYQARVPLGACQLLFPFAATNFVDVSLIDPGELTIETNAPDFSFCPDEIKELRSSRIDLSFKYQWFKDGIPLEGETASTITLPDNDFGGDYTVEVEFSDDCTLESNPPVTVTNEGSSITVPLPEQLILIPRQTLNLEITTDAPIGSPIRWIVDTSVQSSGPLDSPTSSFEATFIGTYRVEIDALDPCDSRLFSETEIFAPVDFDIEIAPQGDISCDQNTVILELVQMSGITSSGLSVPLTEEQLALFDFEWYREGVPTGQTALSTEVSQSAEGASYELRADLRTGEFMNIVSNNLPLDSCPVAASELVPNIVTPNNDQKNDVWALPASMANQQNVEVTIYSPNGQIDFNSVNYQNNWPGENSKTEGRNMVYYYIISKNNSIIKKGSITVMR